MSNRQRYTYTGTGPVKGDSRYGKPTGELVAGDEVLAWPVHAEHPGFLWRVVNLRNGFEMTSPPHDLLELRKEYKEQASR